MNLVLGYHFCKSLLCMCKVYDRTVMQKPVPVAAVARTQ